MNNIDLLLEARWVVTVNDHNTVLENHAIAIDQGRIIAIQPISEARQNFQAARSEQLENQLLMPGLINAHTHVAMNLLRGIADDLPLMEWLQNHIWPAENRWADAEFVKDGSELAIAEMIRGGTTCFNDMYFFPEVTAQVAEQAQLRATIGLMMIDFPTAWGSGPDEYLQKGLELHDRYRNHPLIGTAFAPHAPYTISDEPLEKIHANAEQLQIPIHMHVHETLGEVVMHHENHGVRPLERLKKLGLLNPSLIAVHMTQLSDHEIAELAENGVQVVHCPESNLKLASGFCPVAKLHAAGVNVALGSDGAASNNDLDLFGEMRTAALLAKAVAEDAAAIPATEALRMATINGAKALGIEATTGSLEVGKAADLVAVDISPLETQPLYDPVSQLVYATGRQQVRHSWVAGRQLLRDRQLTTLDEAELLSKAAAWRDKIAAGRTAS